MLSRSIKVRESTLVSPLRIEYFCVKVSKYINSVVKQVCMYRVLLCLLNIMFSVLCSNSISLEYFVS